MNEDILAIGTLDVPIALAIIEALHFSVQPHFRTSLTSGLMTNADPDSVSVCSRPVVGRPQPAAG